MKKISNNTIVFNKTKLSIYIASAMALAALSASSPALAENIVYDGSDTSILKPGNILAPDATTGNNVTINGGNMNQAHGGYYPTPTVEVEGYVTNNTITLNNGTVEKGLSGGMTEGDHSLDNKVIINGGKVNGWVYGGYASGPVEWAPNTTKSNSVIVNNGTITGDVIGGVGTLDSYLNEVTVNGGTIGGNVIGGSIFSTFFPYAHKNTVNINGGTIGGDIIGGDSPSGDSKFNTVNISKDANISNSKLYGGKSNNANNDVFTGNTLNLKGWSGTAKNIQNFQTINIDAPVVQNGSVILKLTDQNGTTLGNGKTGDAEVKTAVNLKSVAPGSKLKTGDRIHLIQNTNGGITGENANNGQVQQGISAKYDVLYEQDANNVDVVIQGAEVNPETGVVNEPRVGSLAFINQGADLMIKEALLGKNVFGAIEGGHSHYNTGSSVDVDGVNFITGINNSWKLGNGQAQAGVFIEAGWGDTKTSNDIDGANLHGSGDTNYYGAGILGRYDWTEGAAKGLYVDASLRAGRLSNKYHNSDVKDAEGREASFDIDSTYYGAHAGVGYLWEINDAYTLDTNLRYFWTHIESDSAKIAGDEFKFDSMDSHRTRLATRLNYTANKKFTPYVGLGYEYEFDGDSNSKVLGLAIDGASLGGSTGIAELGVNFKPTDSNRLTVNAGVTGYFGQREGVTGQFRMDYAF